MNHVVLIITDSHDITTDLLVEHIGSNHIFRFNADRLDDYIFCLDTKGIFIDNGFRKVTDSNIVKVYWRKPFMTRSSSEESLQGYVQRETNYILLDLFQYFHLQHKTVLVKPDSLVRYKKMNFLNLAQQYFRIPQWSLLWGNIMPAKEFMDTEGNIIVKSLSSAKVTSDRIMLTTQVEVNLLSEMYPWFTQELIEASHDLTVVYINGKTFAYIADRGLLEHVDVRKAIGNPDFKWMPYTLPTSSITSIRNLMHKADLKFGRLDFLICQDTIVFLEVNPNGQWAWLDTDGSNGLLNAIIEEIAPWSSTYSLV